MKLSIVVPCYNEAKNIPVMLERFAVVISNADIEVVLVDNGSTDETKTILPNLLLEYGFAKTIRVEINQGYGYGIIQGLKVCKGDFIGWTHADLQTDPSDVLKAWELIKRSKFNQNLYVKGKRKGRPLFDVFFTFGMSLFESIYMGKILYDINAQPNIFSKKFFERWQDPPKDFSLDLYSLYMAKEMKLKVIRFDVIFPRRLHGKSHWNDGSLRAKWKFIKRTIDFSLKLKNRGLC